jgi:copper(I)-binding protein
LPATPKLADAVPHDIAGLAMIQRLFTIVLLSAGLAGAAVAAPSVSNAWIRAMPGALPAGGYFTLANPGPKPVTLIAAQSPACGSLMLHMTHTMGGMTHMMPVDKVDVPAGGSFEFKPGSYHLMCMEPKALKPGTTVPVTLKFADGTSLTASFAVKNATGK